MTDVAYQPPQASGADILSYKGDAALGGGYNSQGVPTESGGGAAEVGDMLKTLQGQQFMRNTQKYNDAIKSRDESQAVLADPSLQVTMDVADADRPALEAQRQAVIDKWKENPTMDDPDAFVNFQKEIGKFKEMAVSSKSRSLEYKKQMAAIAAQTNPQLRNAMIDHLDQQMKKGVMGQVDPYFENPTFDASMFADVPAVPGDPKYAQDENGAYNVTKTTKTPVKAFSAFVSPEALMANNGDRLQKLQLLHDNFVNSNYAQDDNTLMAMNQKLATINASNGLKSSDPDFLQPVAIKGPDGKWVVNDSPAQFGKSMYAYSHYNEKSTTELAPDYEKQMEGQMKMKKEQADINKEELTGKALADKYKADAALAKQKGDVLAEKAAHEKADASAPAVDAINMFKDVSKYQKYTSPEEINKKFNPAIVEGLKRGGAYTEGMELTPLPLTNNYRLSLATSEPQREDAPKDSKGNPILGADGKPLAGKLGKGMTVKKPTTIVAIHKPGAPLEDIKIAGFDKDNKLMKVVTVKESVGELIKANNDYKPGTGKNDIQSKIDRAREVTDELLAQQNGGGNQHTTKTATPKTPAQQSSYSPTAAKEKISNKQYEKPLQVDGKTYYKIEGSYYDGDGNQIKE